VRAVARLVNKKGGAFTLKDLAKIVGEMQKMTTTQLLEIPSMESKRVDMILSGAIILEEIARALGAKRVIPTEYSLRDGIIEEESRLAKSHKRSMLELHLDDLVEYARRFGGEPEHLRHIAALAGDIFDRFRPLHQLDSGWKIYLISTILLRNCGQSISYGGRERHSYYIVKNLDFPSMDIWEHDFIAKLCLYIPGGKLDAKDLNGISKERRRRDAFLKLLALARVIDALDMGQKTILKVRRVQLSAPTAKLVFTGKSTAGIEQLMMERKKKLFEELFGRELILERANS
jgi:exopolyphosphatase/guanosine-5'-triphosphate,3'-diphosphate pyrophosphatase